MKNKILNNRIKSTKEMGTFLFFVLFTLVGCHTKDEHPAVSADKAVVKVNMLGNHYDDQESIERNQQQRVLQQKITRYKNRKLPSMTNIR